MFQQQTLTCFCRETKKREHRLLYSKYMHTASALVQRYPPNGETECQNNNKKSKYKNKDSLHQIRGEFYSPIPFLWSFCPSKNLPTLRSWCIWRWFSASVTSLARSPEFMRPIISLDQLIWKHITSTHQHRDTNWLANTHSDQTDNQIDIHFMPAKFWPPGQLRQTNLLHSRRDRPVKTHILIADRQTAQNKFFLMHLPVRDLQTGISGAGRTPSAWLSWKHNQSASNQDVKYRTCSLTTTHQKRPINTLVTTTGGPPVTLICSCHLQPENLWFSSPVLLVSSVFPLKEGYLS